MAYKCVQCGNVLKHPTRRNNENKFICEGCWKDKRIASLEEVVAAYENQPRLKAMEKKVFQDEIARLSGLLSGMRARAERNLMAHKTACEEIPRLKAELAIAYRDAKRDFPKGKLEAELASTNQAMGWFKNQCAKVVKERDALKKELASAKTELAIAKQFHKLRASKSAELTPKEEQLVEILKELGRDDFEEARLEAKQEALEAIRVAVLKNGYVITHEIFERVKTEQLGKPAPTSATPKNKGGKL